MMSRAARAVQLAAQAAEEGTTRYQFIERIAELEETVEKLQVELQECRDAHALNEARVASGYLERLRQHEAPQDDPLRTKKIKGVSGNPGGRNGR